MMKLNVTALLEKINNADNQVSNSFIFYSLISPSYSETFYLDCVLNYFERITVSSATKKDIFKNKNYRKTILVALNEINKSGTVTYDGITRKYENASFLADEIRIWREIIARGHDQIFTPYSFDRNNGTVNFYNYENDFKTVEVEEIRISGSCKNIMKRICFNLFLELAETLSRFLLCVYYWVNRRFENYLVFANIW